MRKLEIEIPEITRGAELMLSNAQNLQKEALLLSSQKLWSRALFLHQISMEECAKIDMLGASAASLLSGASVDWERLLKALAAHKSKNFANAYFVKATDEERAAREKDIPLARSLFKEAQLAFHEKANSRKNASLYVDFQCNRFISPSECVTEAMVIEIGQMNAEFLQRSECDVRLLGKWAAEPDKAKTHLTPLIARIEEMSELEPKDLGPAIFALMDEMLARLRSDAPSST
jgi:AbiV family abortive infection protein